MSMTRQKQSVQTTLRMTADEPVERFMSRPEVLRIAGFSATTLWREIRRGRFPAPSTTSPGRVGWLASSVNLWLRERAGTPIQTARSEQPARGKSDRQTSLSPTQASGEGQ